MDWHSSKSPGTVAFANIWNGIVDPIALTRQLQHFPFRQCKTVDDQFVNVRWIRCHSRFQYGTGPWYNGRNNANVCRSWPTCVLSTVSITDLDAFGNWIGEKSTDGNHFMPWDSWISAHGFCLVGRWWWRRRKAGISGYSVTNRTCHLKY